MQYYVLTIVNRDKFTERKLIPRYTIRISDNVKENIMPAASFGMRRLICICPSIYCSAKPNRKILNNIIIFNHNTQYSSKLPTSQVGTNTQSQKIIHSDFTIFISSFKNALFL